MSGLEPPARPSQQRAFSNKQTASKAQALPRTTNNEGYHNNVIDNETDEDPPRRGVKRKSKTAGPKENDLYAPQVFFNYDYSKFHEEFRRTFSMPVAPTAVAQSANSSVVETENLSQQPEPNDRTSNSNSSQIGSPVVPAQRVGESVVDSSKRITTNKRAPLAVEDRPSSPAMEPSVEKKARTPRPKGSGIYKTGTWEYVTEEGPPAEQITKVVNEISSVTEAAAQKPVKITRNSYLKMKSMVQGSSAATTPSQEPPARGDSAAVGVEPTISKPISSTEPSNATQTSPETPNSNRRSNRKRTIPNYSTFLGPELDEDPPTTIPSTSHRAAKRQKTTSTIDSPMTQQSTPAADQTTRSTSASTTLQPIFTPEQLLRPKLSWTMIVYEVLANAKTQTLSLAEIIEGVKDRFPYFRSEDQALTLKSSTRNPIYKHPAFYRFLRPDGTMACGLNPGDHYDVKSNKLLTAGSPNANNTPSVKDSEHSTSSDHQQAIAHSNAPGSDLHRSGQNNAVESASHDAIDSENAITSKSLHQPPNANIEVTRISHTENDKLSSTSDQSITRPSTVSTNLKEKSTVAEAANSVIVENNNQVQAERLSHKHLAETFTAEELRRFHQETKRSYFKNLELNRGDVSRILSDIFPIWLNSSDRDLEECARDLQTKYEEDMWASNWFLEFVKDAVTKYETLTYMNYMDKDRPARLQFWLGPSKWNHKTFASSFSIFKDAVDLDQIWTNKHWNDYVTKLFSTACDATWEHRLQPEIDPNPNKVYSTIQGILKERYPDKSAKIWELPKRCEAPAGETQRKDSATGSNSSPRRKTSKTPPSLSKNRN